MQEVSFLSDNLNIHAILVMPDNTTELIPGVIIFHGMTSSETGYIPLATKLTKHGVAVLAVTMRGHGKSDGDFHKSTVAEAISDALAAYDFIITQPGIDAKRIGMIGSSVGAILAGFATEQRPVRSVIFRAPAAYTKDMMQLSMAETMVNEGKQFHEIIDLASTPAGNAISKFTGSILVVASEDDVIIPLNISKSYVDIASHADKKELFIIDGATHTLTQPEWKETFNQKVVNWFKETLT